MQRAGSSPQLTSSAAGGGQARTGNAGVHFAVPGASPELSMQQSNDGRTGSNGFELRDVRTQRQGS
jgi:hypothetical protein